MKRLTLPESRTAALADAQAGIRQAIAEHDDVAYQQWRALIVWILAQSD